MPSLRQQCKERLKVAFDSVRAVSGSLTFILIVDKRSLKVLSSTIKMMELINYGITSVEKLQLKRKKFKKIQAVYLVHPQNFNRIFQDFSQNQQPQYHSIHILSLTKIPPYLMNQLSENSFLVRRLKTLKEINFNFNLFSENQVRLNDVSLDPFTDPLMPQNKEEYQNCVVNTADQLATVLTSMNAFYIVQIFYNKSSLNNFSQKVSICLKQKLETMFKTYQKDGTSNYCNSSPQTSFIILDRTIDPVSPLVRDFHYGPLFYDFNKVQNHHLTIKGKNKQEKTFILDQTDEIMEKYRNMHLAKTMTGLQSDFQQFSQTHVNAKFQKNQNEDLKMNKMAQIIKSMPKYNEFKSKYSLHLDMLSDIFQNYQKNNFKIQGQLQQTIISGINQNGKKIKSVELFDQILKIIQKIKPIEQAKIILMTIMCLDIKPKEKSILIQKLNQIEKFVNLNNCISYLVPNSLFQLNQKKQKDNLILDRHLPKIQQIVKEITNGGQADLKFFRVGGAITQNKTVTKNTNLSNLGRKKIGIENNQNSTKPRLIIFMSSGIGYNQIRSLSQFESTYQIIYVSHNFLTQTQYIQKLSKIGQEDQL